MNKKRRIPFLFLKERICHFYKGSIFYGRTLQSMDCIDRFVRVRMVGKTNMKYLRLKKQADFERLFHKGKRAFSPSLTVIYRPSDKMRMGISIGKKHGKSVKRNRIKRLIREAFRKTQGEMKGAYSFVIIPKVSEKYEYATFVHHLQCMIKKEKL